MMAEEFQLIPQELKDVPRQVQAMSGNRLLKSATPVKISVKHYDWPSIKQYPLPREAEQRTEHIINDLKKNGILVRCTSPCNTPILCVKKPKLSPGGKPVYQFV